MSTAGKPLQNVLWLVGERVGRAAITATVLAAVARYLEPANFGQLNLAIAVLAIVAPLATLGLEGMVVAELVRRPTEAGDILGTAFRLRMMGGFAVAALLGVGAMLAGETFPERHLVMIIALGMIVQPVEVVDFWFQSHLDSRRVVVVRSVAIFAGATLKLWLVLYAAPLSAFAWAQVADGVFIAAGLAWAGARSPHRSGPWKWNPAIARVLWQRGLPIAIANVAWLFSSRLDQLLVRHWLGETQAGVYFAASRLIEVGVFTGTVIALSLFPHLAASQGRSPAEYEARLQGVFDALTGLGWMIALGCTFFAVPVIHLLFGPAYSGAALLLTLQGWGLLFLLSGTARWQFILLSAPTTLNLAIALAHFITLVVMSAWLIPSYGAAGAAAATIVAYAVSCYATSFILPPLRACIPAQTRGLLIVFSPSRWKATVQQFRR